jgi:hypothetical protein
MVFATLSTLHTWPLATDPAHLTRLDNDDTAFNTWVVAWVAHQVSRDPRHLFNAPIFHPAPDALAFSEHMIVPALLGAPLSWGGVSPVLVYNVLVWTGLALSGLAMAAVVRQWTGSGTAGVISGALFAFNAHLLTRYPHLQALHVQFFPIVLYAFDRVLREAGGRPTILLGSMFVLQALCSNYTMVLLTTALIAGFVVRPEPWRAGAARRWLLLAAAAVAVAVVMVPFLLPYYRVRTEQGLVRTLDDVRMYSAVWQDYFATAGRLHYQAWSHRLFEGRTALFPGMTATALALFAIVTGVAWRDHRARMALAFGMTGLVLSFGTSLPGYEFLYDYVPLLQGIRAAVRWGFLLLVAIAILAGFAVARLETRWKGRAWWPAMALALIGLVTVEALRAPLPMMRYDGIPKVHARLKDETVTGLVVFPLYGGSQFNLNAPYLLHQTRHWRPMINGYSSWAPETFYQRAQLLQSFPSDAAINNLHAIGVSHAVLHRPALERQSGKAAVDALRAHPAVEFMFEEDGVIVYRIK